MSDWSSSVVVRANNNSAASPREDFAQSRGGSSASLRSTAVIVTATNTPLTGRGDLSSDVARGVIQPYNSCQRALITSTPTNAPSLPFYSALLDADASSDRARTFWKPDASRGEIGLLETLHRRADNTMMHLLVSSRPSSELRHNFSARSGDCISLDDDLFKLSKTHFALRRMENVDDHVVVDGHTFKSALREQLPQLHQDDYYLVAYRDYSAWAVSHHSAIAKRDSTLGPKYVEQYFAIRVGQNAGSFVAITEAQFLFGCEVLEHQRHSATAAQIASKAVNLFALNTDQYRSMSAVGAPASPHSAGANAGHHSSAAAAAAYVAPSPWDWTPTAIEKRLNHFLDQQYRAVGRLVVKGVVVGCCMYFFVQYVRRGTGLASTGADSSRHSSQHRGGSRRRAAAAQQRYYDDDIGSGSVVGGVLRSVFVTGPKEVFDFILGS